MPKKHKLPGSKASVLNEPAIAYPEQLPDLCVNPNVPSHATQEEWQEYFNRIENGSFASAHEVHQRVSQWLQSQNQ
ncbi:hypothetical protein MASR2M117_26080 [Paludibacter sp.]